METPRNRKTDNIDLNNSLKILPLYQKIGYYLISLFFLIGMFVTSLFIYWTNFPYKVLDVKQPLPIEEKRAYVGGDVIRMTADFCKLQDVEELEIIKFLVGPDKVIELPKQEVVSRVKRGCSIVPLNVIIPTATYPDTGEYYIKYDIVYRPNPLRELHEEFSSESFTIQNKKSPGSDIIK